MPDPLATPDDVAVIWRPLSDAEDTQVTTLILKASAKLRQACPFDIDARIVLFDTTPTDPAALDPVVVADVVATIVKRLLVNPNGFATESETAGPFSKSATFVNRYDKTGSDVRGAIQITDSDIDQLRPAVPSAIPSSFTYKLPAPQVLIPGDHLGSGVPVVVPDVFPDLGAK
jgi:hypothetical protein